jgi:predicted transcriptional regulator
MMEFETVARISAMLSKSFARDFMRLLVTYKSISASEAASRLDLHIKTAQDFLEELSALGIAEKKEVYERKRPYFRYSLKQTTLNIEVDFNALYNPDEESTSLENKIREKQNTGVLFATASNYSFFSGITIFIGEGRKRRERKISLTNSQGRFLYHLPFPNAAFQTIKGIIKKAGIDESYASEILDIVNVLKDYNVIEFSN